MHGMLYQDGVQVPTEKIKVVDIHPSTHGKKLIDQMQNILKNVKALREEQGLHIRAERTGYQQMTILKDPIVGIKLLFLNTYPELKEFLEEGHEDFLTGETHWVKNEWGEWEEEPYYSYTTQGFTRGYCGYSALDRDWETP